MKLPPMKKTYAERIVLNTPVLELEAGRIYAVIGSNGSGKTTLARILAGVEQADDCAALKGVSVGYMPQKSFAYRMSTRANLLLSGHDRERMKKLSEALRISHLADKPAHKLSGGETARMALARLLMKKRELLILDEPTAAMDMESTLFAEALIKEYVAETGCVLLLVTHSLSQARRLADRILFLKNGELVEFGDKQQILTAPKDPRTREFIDFYRT